MPVSPVGAIAIGRRCARAEHTTGDTAGADVLGDTLAQLYFIESLFVAAKSALCPRPRLGVIVKHSRHSPLMQRAQIFDTGNGLHLLPGTTRCCLMVASLDHTVGECDDAGF
jgi:hypothetical protein